MEKVLVAVVSTVLSSILVVEDPNCVSTVGEEKVSTLEETLEVEANTKVFGTYELQSAKTLLKDSEEKDL